MKLRINELPKLQPDQQSHWSVRSRYRKRWRKQVADAIYLLPDWRSHVHRPIPEVPTKARITATRFSSSVPDADNLSISFKTCIDSIVEVLPWIKSDGPDDVEVTYRHEYAPPKKGYIEIEVRPSESDPSEDI
jgi:hypothetical protein